MLQTRGGSPMGYVGSIFPEKLVFDGEKVRTARINAAVALFDLKINGLEIEEKEKAGDFSGFVKEAPPAGLEIILLINHL